MTAPTPELRARRIVVALGNALEDAGQTIEAAADQTGIPVTALRLNLLEGTPMRFGHLELLCQFLDIKPSVLFARAEQPCPPWCQGHPDREPFGHVATLYATGWALTLEQIEDGQPTVYMPETATEDGLDATAAMNLATALHAAARTLTQ